MRTIRKAEPVLQPAPLLSCAFRYGAHLCKMRPTSGRHCVWHAYWLRLVDAGNIARQQYDEFCEWWEQFQPYGIYGDNPGQWWADRDVLWPAMTGLGEPPVMTSLIQRELILRRAEVRHYKQGLPSMKDPWPRIEGKPLPEWNAAQWQEKIDEAQRVLPAG